MKRELKFVLLCCAAVFVVACSVVQAQDTLCRYEVRRCWEKTFPALHWDMYQPTIYRSLFDEEGNVYVLGRFDGYGTTLDGNVICPLDSLYTGGGGPTGTRGLVVVKYDTCGRQQWMKAVRSSNESVVNIDMAYRDGKLYVLFDFRIDIDVQDRSYVWWQYFDSSYVKGRNVRLADCHFPYPLNNLTSGKYLAETHIVTLDCDGTVLTDHGVSQSGVGYKGDPFHVRSPHIIVDAMHNVYVFGQIANCADTLTFIVDRDTSNPYLLSKPSKRRQFVTQQGLMKFDPDMRLQWAKFHTDSLEGFSNSSINSPHRDSVPYIFNLIESIRMDEANNIYVDYNPDVLIEPQRPCRIWLDSLHVIQCSRVAVALESPPNYIVKYDTSGNILWCQQIHQREVDSSMGVYAIIGNRMGVDSNYVYWNLFQTRRGTPSTNRIYPHGGNNTPNCFFDAGYEHPYMLYTRDRYRGLLVRYDRETGAYVSHDTVPGWFSTAGSTPVSRDGYMLTRVNAHLSETAPAAGEMAYLFRRENLRTGEVCYGDSMLTYFPGNSCSLEISNNGHILRWGTRYYALWYDPVFDRRLHRSYDLVALSSDTAMGYVVGGGSYPYGDTAILEARPLPRHAFVRWSDSVFANPRAVVVTHSDTLVALFCEEAGLEPPSSVAMSLYPNPAQDVIRVQCPSGMPVTSLELFDMIGNSVAFSRPTDPVPFLRLPSSLPNGAYIVKVSTPNGIRYLKATVKR